MAAVGALLPALPACAGNAPPVAIRVPPAQLVPGTPLTVTLMLTNPGDKTPVTFAQLKEVHTKRLHLLAIDPGMTDYQHIHPTAGKKPGEYRFTFTPKQPFYFLWADVTPLSTDKPLYLRGNLGDLQSAYSAPRFNGSASQAEAGGLHFSLQFDRPLVEGDAAMGTLHVSDAGGKPFTRLEPLMGAFAHIVGFDADLTGLVHIHPMGAEPAHAGERGGPELEFHLQPSRAGYIRLYVQVQVNGKDVYAPFDLHVEAREPEM